MGWEKRITWHSCPLPKIEHELKGSIWKCDRCGIKYRLEANSKNKLLFYRYGFWYKLHLILTDVWK